MVYYGSTCVGQWSKPSHNFCEQGSSLLEGLTPLALSFCSLCMCMCVCELTWMSPSSYLPVLKLNLGSIFVLRAIFYVNILFVLIQSSMLADMKYSNSW